MDWSFAASRAGAAPAVMSFRTAAREEQGHPQHSAFDGAKKQQQQTSSRVLTQQVVTYHSWFTSDSSSMFTRQFC